MRGSRIVPLFVGMAAATFLGGGCASVPVGADVVWVTVPDPVPYPIPVPVPPARILETSPPAPAPSPRRAPLSHVPDDPATMTRTREGRRESTRVPAVVPHPDGHTRVRTGFAGESGGGSGAYERVRAR
jgi:hypothetical protein